MRNRNYTSLHDVAQALQSILQRLIMNLTLTFPKFETGYFFKLRIRMTFRFLPEGKYLLNNKI